MKSQKILLAAALLSLGIVSCQKDEQVVTRFTAGIESSAKTHLATDGAALKWDAGDEVMVYSNAAAEGAVFTATNLRNNDGVADLESSVGVAEGTQYTAIHPAGIAASASSVTLPAVQQSADGSLRDFPMYAQSENMVFNFDNLCGALKIQLHAACTVSSIQVTVPGANLNGTYTVSTEGGLALTGCTNGTATTTLELTAPVAVDVPAGHDFYIYLPAGEYTGMQIAFVQPDGSYCTKTSSGTVSIARSMYTTATFSGLNFTADLLSGVFSVGNGRTVRFAKGNLQYVNDAWRFAEHQYDVLGAYGPVCTYDENAWDLFGWSANSNNNYGRSSLMDNAYYSGSFIDWGTAINPGGAATPWRTLSANEWRVLLGTGEQRAGKYGLATISVSGSTNPAHGLVLLPDNWEGNAITPGCDNVSWTANSYTAAEWEQMEAAGAVFLPAAGFRTGEYVYNVGTGCCYWSSSQSEEGAAGMTFFRGDNPSVGSIVSVGSIADRYYGFSVRLVQTIRSE